MCCDKICAKFGFTTAKTFETVKAVYGMGSLLCHVQLLVRSHTEAISPVAI